VRVISRLRGALRLRVWTWRSRRVLRRAGCDLEVVAPHGFTCGTLPVVEPTLQRLGTDGETRGRLRIELGQWVHLGRHTVIEVLPSASSELRLDDGVRCFQGARFVLFGGTVHVGAWTRIRDGVMLKSSGMLRCGEHVILQSYCMLHCHRELLVENRVTFAERVSVLDSDHLADGSDVHTQVQPLAVDPVLIAENAWLGANAVVLRGAQIGRNVVVAAGSVVRGGNYPAGWLVAGAPAVAKRALTQTPSGSASG